jgi:ABC-type transport system substrate-binding protein
MSLFQKVGLSFVALAVAGTTALAKPTTYTPKPSSYEKLPEAKKGGTVFMTLSNNPKVMNPVLSSDANSSTFDGLFFASLFTEDSDNLNPLPYLAESYTVSADRKTYTFTLNKNAKWQDGAPVTSADLKFTFDTIMDPKTDAAPQRAYWQGVTLEVKDTHTIVFKVKEPRFDTLRTLYLFTAIQKKQFEKEKNFNQAKDIMNPIGNGPFKLKGFSRDQKVDIERNKEWWGNSLPHMKNRWNMDNIVFRIIPDTNLNYERFVKGEVDIMDFGGPGIEIFAKRVRSSDKSKVGDGPTSGKAVWATEIENNAPRGFSYVGWNLRKPMFKSKKTRQALAHLADVKDIADKVFYGFHYQSSSPFGSLTMNSDADLRKSMFPFDTRKAIALLKEDGWADTDNDGVLDKVIDGKKVPFKFTLKFNSNNPARGKIAQILQQNFKRAGIQIDIRSMEWNAYLEDVDKREFDAIVMGWTATPYPNPRQIWHTDSEKDRGSNFVGYSNKNVDELIDKANVETDLAKRAKILQEINRILYDDQPYMWLTEPRSMLAGFNKKVTSPVWAMTYDVGPPVDVYRFE